MLSRAIGHLLRDLSAAPQRAPAGTGEAAAALARLARAALAGAPGPLLSALRRPTVGGLLRCLRDPGLAHRDAVFVELVAQLAFELALAGALAAPVRLTRFPARLLSIPARLALSIAGDARTLTFESGALTVDTTRVDLTAPVSIGPAPLSRHPRRGIALAEVDNNPITALFEAHPDKEGNALDLGGHPASAWTAALAESLKPDRAPPARSVLQLVVSQIVPVGFHAERRLSASYPAVAGTVHDPAPEPDDAHRGARPQELAQQAERPVQAESGARKRLVSPLHLPCAPIRARSTASSSPYTPSSPWRASTARDRGRQSEASAKASGNGTLPSGNQPRRRGAGARHGQAHPVGGALLAKSAAGASTTWRSARADEAPSGV